MDLLVFVPLVFGFSFVLVQSWGRSGSGCGAIVIMPTVAGASIIHTEGNGNGHIDLCWGQIFLLLHLVCHIHP